MRIRLKLNPALARPELSPGDRRLWLWTVVALRRQEGVEPVWSLEVCWKRLLLGTAALAFAGYLCAVTALWFWLDRVPHNQVDWPTLALAPVRWEEFRVKRGDTVIAAALERLQQRDYVEAYHGLRVGLARSPGNVRGRIVLAGLLNGADPSRALTVLEEGLAHTPEDPELLRALFGLYRRQSAGARGLEKSAGLLGRRPPLAPAAHRQVAGARVTLLSDAGRLAEAEQALRELPPGQAPGEGLAALQQRADILMRLGRPAEARTLLADAERSGPAPVEAARLRAELAIAEGDGTGLESALRRMKSAADDQPQAHVYAFRAWHRMKRPSLRDRAEQEFYQAFGHNDVALQLFAASAVQLELPEPIHRAQDVAVANGLNPFAFRVHLTELALRRGEFDQAFRQLSTWERQIDTLKPQQRAYPEFLEHLTRVSIAGAEQPLGALTSHLANLRGRATVGMYRLAGEVLERADQPEGARQVVQLGLRLYPWSDALRSAEQRLARRAVVVAAAAPARQEGEAPGLPVSGEDALRRLDAHLAAGEFTAARTLLRRLKETPPAWLAQQAAGLAVREWRLALLSLDPLAARATLRAHLERHPGEEEALRLVRLADTLLQEGRVAEARLVRDEVAGRRGVSPAVGLALRSLAVPDDLAEALAAPAAAFAAIDRALDRRQPAEALRVFERLEHQPPRWRAEAEEGLAVREVRMRFGLDQEPRALAVWRELVLRPGRSRAAAFRFVRELLAAGEEERALLLARELARLLPGDPAAAKLRAEAEAPRPRE